jgi:hypothetical protein
MKTAGFRGVRRWAVGCDVDITGLGCSEGCWSGQRCGHDGIGLVAPVIENDGNF